MKVTIKNLGVLESAEYELGELTVVCGKNNTGTCLFCFSRLRAKTQRISMLVLTCTVFERVYF
jgi:predicted ATPase